MDRLSRPKWPRYDMGFPAKNCFDGCFLGQPNSHAKIAIAKMKTHLKPMKVVTQQAKYILACCWACKMHIWTHLWGTRPRAGTQWRPSCCWPWGRVCRRWRWGNPRLQWGPSLRCWTGGTPTHRRSRQTHPRSPQLQPGPEINGKVMSHTWASYAYDSNIEKK